MRCQDSHEYPMNLVEVMRDELRHEKIVERKHHRAEEWNKRRVALGEITYDEKSWDTTTIINKSEKLKKESLSVSDYLKLQTALIQNNENIKGFLSVNNITSALIRDISTGSPAIKLAAVHCLCNITLANSKCCTMIYKKAGPFIVEQLETLSNPLLEVNIWIIGNLCSGSKWAFKSLYAQGCINRLLSLLRESDKIILPSIIYAVTHCLHEGSELMSDAETAEMAEILVVRSCFETATGLWALALLSSKKSCRKATSTILSPVFDNLVLKINDECPDTTYITAAIRLLANLVTEASLSVADIIFNNSKYSLDDICRTFDKILLYPHIHVRKEMLWLIGNLYNNSQPNIKQTIHSLLSHLSSLQYSIQSIN